MVELLARRGQAQCYGGKTAVLDGMQQVRDPRPWRVQGAIHQPGLGSTLHNRGHGGGQGDQGLDRILVAILGTQRDPLSAVAVVDDGYSKKGSQ